MSNQHDNIVEKNVGWSKRVNLYVPWSTGSATETKGKEKEREKECVQNNFLVFSSPHPLFSYQTDNIFQFTLGLMMILTLGPGGGAHLPLGGLDGVRGQPGRLAVTSRVHGSHSYVESLALPQTVHVELRQVRGDVAQERSPRGAVQRQFEPLLQAAVPADLAVHLQRVRRLVRDGAIGRPVRRT